MRSTKIAIIGAGPAGCAAAVQCKRLGVSPVLLDRKKEPGGLLVNAFCVENYPGLLSPVSGMEFCARLAGHLSRFQVEIECAEVTDVRFVDGGWLVKTDHESLLAQNVIICSGTTPQRLPIQEQDNGVFIYNEVRPFLKAHPSCESMLIIGGGEAAFDFSLSVASTGARVSILVRGKKERVRGRLVEMVKQNKAVNIMYNTSVVELRQQKDGIVAMLNGVDGQEERRVSGLIAAVGRVGATSFIISETVKRNFSDALTPQDGLFICGDARLGALGQAGIAVGDGLLAAALTVKNVVKFAKDFK